MFCFGASQRVSYPFCCFCSMVHNAHNSAQLPPPQASMTHNAHAYAQPCPSTTSPFFFPTHTCHNVPAFFYLLTSSPPARAFPGSEHKRKTYALKETNHSVCVCKNALEREGVYTHTGQRNMVKPFFFFLSFVSERYNQILPYSYDLFFFGGGNISFFLILIKPTTPSNFLNVFFYYMHIFFTQTK